ncbi:putative cytochrome p450 [Lyophyllum shimeji]|uniref:Cytochrome p450 n=1 Tax=Lyophyllum shimeji TaxID=47721 RepID=A0A9P3PYD8_LYOSH|nr:putative cytochrome p450 [Lyophyllum shimeji]
MESLVPSLFCLLVAVFVGVLFKRWGLTSSALPYPPGPKPRLISGNAHDLPKAHAWLTYTRWANQYGGVYHIREYHQHIIVVNTLKDAIALFDRRSQIYSDRPTSTMVELMGWEFNIALIPYGDKWRRHRRLFQQNFKKEASLTYQPVQTRKIHEMLYSLLTDPEDYALHYKNLAGAIVMATMFDKHISLADVNRFSTAVERAVAKLSEAFLPGAFAVNLFPFLRHIPSWLPGAGFKRLAKECKAYTDAVRNIPFRRVKEKMASDAEVVGLAARLLEKNDEKGGQAEAEEDIKEVTATAFVGGAETTVSVFGTFFYAMLVNPDIQRKAQEELDTVIGTQRLPAYSDRGALPFLEAVFREVMRWHPVAPLGVSHATSDDDVYNGYYIPKGSVVIANIWAMTRDESIYSQPELFRPERFLDDKGQLNDDDTVLAFGFGRRICPGRHMASATVWLTMATVLSTFNITKAKDMNGNEISVSDDYSGSLVRHKLPFACSITPRSPEARNLILEAQDTAHDGI